jgi:hypothetical protein
MAMRYRGAVPEADGCNAKPGGGALEGRSAGGELPTGEATGPGPLARPGPRSPDGVTSPVYSCLAYSCLVYSCLAYLVMARLTVTVLFLVFGSGEPERMAGLRMAVPLPVLATLT